MSRDPETGSGRRPRSLGGEWGRRSFVAAASALAAGATPSLAAEETDPIENDEDDPRQTLDSPDGGVEVTFDLDDGRPEYGVSYGGEEVLEPSALGFEFDDSPPLTEFDVTGVERDSVDETWEPVWGTTDEVENRYEEMAVGLEERDDPGRALTLIFRAYDDGVGFRYVFPEQDDLGEFAVASELTEFRFADDYDAWWIPDDYDSYEYLYERTPLSEIEPLEDQRENATDLDGVNTPVTMVAGEGTYLSVHEAALTDYAGMTLTRIDDEEAAFESTLVPWPDGTKVKAEAPHASPWRTVQLGSDPGDLVESNLIVNLNEPNRIDDTSWIEPGKYMGIWWEIHIGKSTWHPGPDVGATTANAKRYVDFASDHGIESLLVEGWNEGWAGGFEQWSNPPERFDFTESIDRYDLEEVVEYGQEQDPPVDVSIHNENGGGVSNYEDQLEEAYDYYQELGISSAKLGYVSEEGLRLDDGDDVYHHHGQRMVNHYRTVTEAAAEHEIMLNIHEPIKPTGVRRTYPNLMTREGVSGLEYENFRPQGNPPGHTLVLPFTRMLGGPLDYTPGIFDIRYEEYGESRVHNTVARQLALYPILFSGLQMVADLPEHYDDLDAFEFIEDVPADWHETVVVDAEIGSSLVMARRKGEEWYVGSGTDDTPRTLEVPLEFLDDDREYVAEVYADAPEADYETNPEAVTTAEFFVTAEETLHASMVAGGGQAVRLYPADDDEAPEDAAEYEPPAYEYGPVVVQSEVATDEPIVATLEVTNEGGLVGGERAFLFVDGESRTERFVRAGAGESAQVDLPVEFEEPGEYEVAIGQSADDPIASETVTVTEPIEEFEWLSYDGFEVPDRVAPNDPIEIEGTVTNDGDETTFQVLTLTVDDELARAHQVELESGDEEEVTFSYAFEDVGTHEVELEATEPQTVEVTYEVIWE